MREGGRTMMPWKPRHQARPLTGFQRATFGLTTADAVAQAICVTCPKKADAFCCEKSAREYRISGMCQSCQDSVFGKHKHP